MWCDGFCGILINIFVIIFFVLVLHYVYLLWNCDYWKKRGVFCPDPKALFGNLPGQVTGKRHIMYDLEDLYKEFKDKYGYIGIFNFRQPKLLVFDPEIIKDIMIKYFRYFQGTEFYGKFDDDPESLFGKHPFIKIGEEWKTKRAEISPAFTHSRIKASHPITQEMTAKMINYIKKENAKEGFDGFDAKDLASRFTISVVSNSIYNVDPKSFEDGEESEILIKSLAFLAPSKQFMVKMMLTTIYPFLSKFLKFNFSSPDADKFYIELMNNAVKFREENKIQRPDYLDYLMNLKIKKEISELDIAAHGASFLIDGFDTSSTAISAALKELGDNKDCQQKLREDINNLMPRDEDFTYDNIVNLPYLEQVWQESLRIHSPGSHNTRYCTESVEMEMPKDKKLFIEKGSIVYFPIDAIQMDPEHFPNPEKFDPERFSPENGGAKAYMERGVFLPFGIGPRICPGNRFAVAQAKMAIASIVKNFDISINPKSPKKYILHPQAFLTTLVGCVVDLKEIKQK